MGRLYDFDEDVRRFAQRVLSPPPASRPPTAGQLSLFASEEFKIDPHDLRRYESGGLVLDASETLFSRAVSLHSAPKAAYARRYAEIVGTAMRRKWQLWWVELFAGPGELYIRDTQEFVPGSPIEALAITNPFHGYVFADLDRRCTESLSRRIDPRANTYVLEGDANSAALLDEIATIVPRNALVVLYGDQEGLDLNWDTVKYFVDRYRYLDLLLNLPVAGVVRALAAGYESKAAAVLGHAEPHRLVEGVYETGARGSGIREYYERRLAAEGFDKIEAVTVRLTGRNVPLYDLLLASRHALAPKFFGYAVDIREASWEAAS
jgi:three-Cys-motif partner protein